MSCLAEYSKYTKGVVCGLVVDCGNSIFPTAVCLSNFVLFLTQMISATRQMRGTPALMYSDGNSHYARMIIFSDTMQVLVKKIKA